MNKESQTPYWSMIKELMRVKTWSYRRLRSVNVCWISTSTFKRMRSLMGRLNFSTTATLTSMFFGSAKAASGFLWAYLKLAGLWASTLSKVIVSVSCPSEAMKSNLSLSALTATTVLGALHCLSQCDKFLIRLQYHFCISWLFNLLLLLSATRMLLFFSYNFLVTFFVIIRNSANDSIFGRCFFTELEVKSPVSGPPSQEVIVEDLTASINQVRICQRCPSATITREAMPRSWPSVACARALSLSYRDIPPRPSSSTSGSQGL